MTNSPRQRFHSQLFCKFVRYFCWTLYNVRIRRLRHVSTLLKLYKLIEVATLITLGDLNAIVLPYTEVQIGDLLYCF